MTIKTKRTIDQAFFTHHKIVYKKIGSDLITFVYKGDINELLAYVSKYKLESLRIADVKLEDIFGEFYEEREQ